MDCSFEFQSVKYKKCVKYFVTNSSKKYEMKTHQQFSEKVVVLAMKILLSKKISQNFHKSIDKLKKIL